jgi:phage terminase large subunit-like protein
MSLKLMNVHGENGTVLREGKSQPYALISLDTMRGIIESLQNAEVYVSKITEKEASVAFEIIRDKLNPLLEGLEEASKQIGVEIQIANPDFEYERARRELDEAMKKLQELNGSDGPSAA